MYTVPKPTDYSLAALDKATADLLAALKEESQAVASESDWETFRIRWGARNNSIRSAVVDLWLKGAPKEAKRLVGQRVNEIIGRIETVIGDTHDRARTLALSKKMVAERAPAIDCAKSLIEESKRAAAENPSLSVLTNEEALRRAEEQLAELDITLPGIRRPIGAEHPVIKTIN